MSLILEALRKSEAERRRGQAPDVFAEVPVVAPGPAPAFAHRIWIGGALVVLFTLVWLAYAMRSPAPPVDDVDITAATAPAIRMPAPAPVIARPAPAAVAGPTRPADRRTAGALPAAPVTAQAQPPQSLATPVAAADDTHPAASPIVLPPTQPVVVTPPAIATAPQAEDQPLALAELAPDERQQLPPLKLSMHLWDADPARRFVILDGSRLHQGDRIGAAVIVEIASDSVQLDWNGRALRLPLR